MAMPARLEVLAAPLRLALGIAQMTGSLAALVLLATEGLTPRACVLAVATTLMTLASRALFERSDARGSLAQGATVSAPVRPATPQRRRRART